MIVTVGVLSNPRAAFPLHQVRERVFFHCHFLKRAVVVAVTCTTWCDIYIYYRRGKGISLSDHLLHARARSFGHHYE